MVLIERIAVNWRRPLRPTRGRGCVWSWKICWRKYEDHKIIGLDHVQILSLEGDTECLSDFQLVTQ
jgi:hypothetical protein